MQADDQPIAGGENPVGQNQSFEELLASRFKGHQPDEEPESNPEEPTQDTEDSEEPEEQSDETTETDADEEPTEEDESESEESEIDLLTLSAEQIQELAKKGKSRLLQRIGELTAQKKALEEKLASQPQPKVKEVNQSELPEFVRSLGTAEQIQAKYAEIERSLEVTEALLEEHEDYGPDELITVGDKDFTKRQLRQAARNARETLTKFLPAQAQHLAMQEQFKALETQYTETAKKEVPEILDEESEIGKNYRVLVDDPLVKKVKEQVPEIGFQIEYILAHAARSIFGKKAKPVAAGAGERLKTKPSASPVSSGVAGASKAKKDKAAEAYKRFEASGSIEDLIAHRLAKISH